MLKSVISVLVLLIICLSSRAQGSLENKEIKLENYYNCNDSLCKHESNKTLIPSFEIATLIALSHYPELKDTRIVFVRKSIRTTAACRPKWTFVFSRSKSRIYKIYINNDDKKIGGAMMEEIPFDAQVGLIGHELGHVADYSRMGVWKIIATGFQYLFVSGKSRVEKRVDAITIAHHLGWQLYDFDNFIFNRSKVSESYKVYKRKVYYKPEELLLLLGKN